MTKEEFETFISLREKFDQEVEDLFDYIKKKYLDVLRYGKYSSLHHYNIYDDEICIEYYDYGYDIYDSQNLYIPLNDFLSNPFEWADAWANNILAEKQKEEEKAIKAKEKKEKEELQRLKEKYEKQ